MALTIVKASPRAFSALQLRSNGLHLHDEAILFVGFLVFVLLFHMFLFERACFTFVYIA
jgi:hypothetical protein